MTGLDTKDDISRIPSGSPQDIKIVLRDLVLKLGRIFIFSLIHFGILPILLPLVLSITFQGFLMENSKGVSCYLNV